MTQDEAMKLALDALDRSLPRLAPYGEQDWLDSKAAITAIKEALAQPEQEPVGLIESLKDAQPCCGEYQTCWRACTFRGKFLAQRPWVGLTDEERTFIILGIEVFDLSVEDVLKEAEAKLRSKNT
jgi:hypothetical protein